MRKIWLSTLVAVIAAVSLAAAPHTPALSANVPDAPTNGGVIRIVVDNDFAILAGDANNVSRIVLQNDVVWYDQVSNATTYSIALNGNETYLYLIPMGGGGQEDIGGTLNGVDITSIASGPEGMQRAISKAGGTVQDGYLMLQQWLSDFSAAVGRGDVANGPYSVQLQELQTALSDATWGDPPAYTTGWGPGQMVTGKAFRFPDSSAVAFRIRGTSLGGGVVTAGDGQATVGWSPSANDGGSPILDYTATAYRASDNSSTGRSCTTSNSTSTQCIVTGLTNGLGYYFKITARNAIGSSVESAASATVTPRDLTAPTLTLAATEAASASNNVTFTLTANEAIDCSTLSSTPDVDLGVSGGTLTTVTQKSSKVCEIAVATNVATGQSASVTVTRAATFSVADIAGNVQSQLSGSPATVVVTVPAPTTTTTSTTTTSTTTTTTTTTTTLPPVLIAEITTPVGQSQIAAVSPSSSTTAPVRTTSTTTTSTTLPAIATNLDPAQAPNAPDAQVGEVAAIIDGKIQDVVLERRNAELHVRAAGVTMVVNAVDENSNKLPLDSDGSIAVSAASSLRLQAAGFKPESDIGAWMFSTPVSLGVSQVETTGRVDKLFAVPANLEPGLHRIVFKGNAADGRIMTVAIGVRVGSSGGTNVWSWLLLVVLVSAMAFAIVLPARRRRRDNASV